MDIHKSAQQFLRLLLCGINLRFKELRSAEDIVLNSGIFFCCHQFFCKIICENWMLFIFCMKRPPERTRQGGNAGFIIHFFALPTIFTATMRSIMGMTLLPKHISVLFGRIIDQYTDKNTKADTKRHTPKQLTVQLPNGQVHAEKLYCLERSRLL